MLIRKLKTFSSVDAEEKLLNKMGAKKRLLIATSPLFYVFAPSDTVWSYSAEWLDSSPDTEENQKYIAEKCEKENLKYCGKRNCFAYFASEGDTVPEKSYEAKYKIKKRYRSLSVFWSVVFAYMTGLLIYNVVWAEKFKDMGYKVHDDTAEIERIFDFVVGKNPAVLFLYLVIPLTAMVLTLTALYWNEYGSWMKKCPRIKKKKNNNKLVTEATDEKPQL